MRDKSHSEFIERWAEHVKSVPREKWKAEQTIFINETYKKAFQFYERLSKTEKGREILKRLREERIKK